MAKRKKSAKKTVRRTPKRLSHTLYSYVEPNNGEYAREFGKKYFGSFSAYIDVLITEDRQNHFSAKWMKAPVTKKTQTVTPIRRKKATKHTTTSQVRAA